MASRFVPGIACVVVGLVLLCAPVAMAQDADFWRRIDEAIDKGAEYLKGKQLTQGADAGSWGGTTPSQGYVSEGEPHLVKIGICAWALYALLKAEVPPDDDVIVKGFKYLHDNRNVVMSDYERAAVLLAIDAKYEAMKRIKLKGMDPRMVAKWRDRTIPPKGKDAKLASSVTKDLLQNQSRAGGWRYGPEFAQAGPEQTGDDNSATQLVLLGLKAARRMKVTVKWKVFWQAARFTIGEQQEKGEPVRGAQPADDDGGEGGTGTFMAKEGDQARGWPYMMNPVRDEKFGDKAISGSMTTAGICSLLVCKSELQNLPKFKAQMEEQLDRAMFDGVGWLVNNYTVDLNPPSNPSHYYYYLYGLERVGVIGEIDMIGPHHWYTDGAQVLMERQGSTGGWEERSGAPRNVLSTAFALLFLTRGSTPVGIELTR